MLVLYLQIRLDNMESKEYCTPLDTFIRRNWEVLPVVLLMNLHKRDACLVLEALCSTAKIDLFADFIWGEGWGSNLGSQGGYGGPFPRMIRTTYERTHTVCIYIVGMFTK